MRIVSVAGDRGTIANIIYGSCSVYTYLNRVLAGHLTRLVNGHLLAFLVNIDRPENENSLLDKPVSAVQST